MIDTGGNHMLAYTACYTKLSSGYMGQLLEWPEVITEGSTLEECRAMLLDALREMTIVCREDGLPIPESPVLFERLSFIPALDGETVNVC